MVSGKVAPTMVGVRPPHDIPTEVRAGILCGTNVRQGLPFTYAELFEWDETSVEIRDTPYRYEDEDSRVFQTKSDYDRKCSVEVGGKGSGLFWSMSGNVTFQSDYGSSTSASDACFMNSKVQQTWYVHRTKTGTLNLAFANAIDKLPDTVDTKDPDLSGYKTFFETYGTHYLQSGAFGGSYSMQSIISQRLFSQTNHEALKANITAAYDGLLTKGSVTAKTAYETSSWLMQNSMETHVTLLVMGGFYETGDSGFDQNKWTATCREYPCLLVVPDVPSIELPVLAPISKLAPDSKKAAAMDQALAEYLPRPPIKQSLLGNSIAIPLMHEMTSIRDGFLSGYLNITDVGSRGLIGVKLNNELLYMASAHNYTKDDRWVNQASLFLPVPADFAYIVKPESSCGDIHPATYRTDLIKGTLDKPVKLPMTWGEVSRTADTDGFLLCQVIAPHDGDRCEALLKVGDAIWAATSEHIYTPNDTWYPTESFCVPIPALTAYKLSAKITSGSPIAQAYWIPLKGAKLEKLVSKDAGVIYPATTDGFLVAVLTSDSEGNRGYVTVHVGKEDITDDKLRQSPAVAGTSIHWFTGSDTWLPSNTLTVPVRRGDKYVAQFTATSALPRLTLYFVPITLSK